MKNATVTMTIDEFKEMEKLVELGKFVTDFNEKTKELERREKEVLKAEGKVKVINMAYGFIETEYKNMDEFEGKIKKALKINRELNSKLYNLETMTIREFKQWRKS